MNTKRNKRKDYSEKYFTSQFDAVGEFDKQALLRNTNWFTSQLWFFEKHFTIRFNRAKAILEVGCAIGGIANFFQQKTCVSYAVDISKYAIDRAKKLSPGVRFIVCDIQEDIPIQKQFDFVFAFEVLEHLTDPLMGLKHIRRRLSKGGMLIATTPYPYQKYVNINTHVSVLAPKEWKVLMKKAGFTNVRFQPVTFTPFLYRIHPKLGVIFPINSNLPFINSTVFYVAR